MKLRKLSPWLSVETWYVLAGRQGLEPRYADPESAVLPLDDLPRIQPQYNKHRTLPNAPAPSRQAQYTMPKAAFLGALFRVVRPRLELTSGTLLAYCVRRFL